MKTRLAALVAGLTCLLTGGVSSRAAVSFSAGIEISSPNEFYEPLTPYGEWVSVGSYGRCWHPINVERGWRPYCEGHWEWTDCGWYWVSDEPWAWACYHYGSWVDDPNYGWCWLPATEWAPSWVVWREAPDYIGWAPCGPGGAVLAPSLFVFVDAHHFQERIRPNTVIVNNTTIINRTRVINDIRREDREFDGSRRRVVVNAGPRVDFVAQATGRTFTPKPIRDVVRETPVPERIRRTGTIERPVLREQNVQGSRNIQERQQRDRTTEQQQRERQVSPTGREQPRTVEQPEQRRPSPQRPEQVRPEQRQTPATPGQPEQVRPEQRQVPPTQVRPEQRPGTQVPERRDQVRPEQQPTPAVPGQREQTRPEQRPTPQLPERRDQVRPEQSIPPTGRGQQRVLPEQQQTRPNTPRPEQVRPEQRPTPPIPQRSEPVQPQRPTPQVPPERVLPPTGREVPKEEPRREQPGVREAPPVRERPAPAEERGRGQEKKDKGPDGQ